MIDYTIADFDSGNIIELSELHMKAFKGSMNTRMGKKYVKDFIYWFSQNESCITLKAVEKKRIIGYIVGAPIGYGNKMNRDLLKTGVWGILTHPSILLSKRFFKTILARFKLLFQTNHNNSAANKFELRGKGISLIGIGVDPEYNGFGIGQNLISAFEKKATQLGMSYMRLSVYDNNLRALRLYERSGWSKLTNDGKTLYYYKNISGNL
jgi:ribosomal protein S18 acetylase RimI-like enzyme